MTSVSRLLRTAKKRRKAKSVTSFTCSMDRNYCMYDDIQFACKVNVVTSKVFTLLFELVLKCCPLSNIEKVQQSINLMKCNNFTRCFKQRAKSIRGNQYNSWKSAASNSCFGSSLQLVLLPMVLY